MLVRSDRSVHCIQGEEGGVPNWMNMNIDVCKRTARMDTANGGCRLGSVRASPQGHHGTGADRLGMLPAQCGSYGERRVPSWSG